MRGAGLILMALVVTAVGTLGISAATAAQDSAEPAVAPRPLTEAFCAELERIGLRARPLAGWTPGEDWAANRDERVRQLREMMGLDPLPERTDLKAEVRGSFEHDGVVIERVLFQSLPGLYVTGNLYRAKDAPEGEKRPGILYVCGHGEVKKDGVIYGNKTYYQQHGLAFAKQGFVCLVVDTLQLGEVPGLHHGTYRMGMWWWQARGYSPAGIEAWNGIRALDYLVSRVEVDGERLGVTGRSGGGASSWWLGALDERLKAVAPVAGITDLEDHLVNPWADGRYPSGVIEGHCDCMYFVNTYRWDFDMLAALVAPRDLLIVNTDHDPIFPVGGVARVYEEALRLYDGLGVRERLGLVVGRGGHDDTDELQAAVSRFFQEVLRKGEEAPEEVVIANDQAPVPVERLKVLEPGETMADEINGTIHERLVPQAAVPEVPEGSEDWARMRSAWIDALEAKTFVGWPSATDRPAITVRPIVNRDHAGALQYTAYELEPWPGVSVMAAVLRPSPSGAGRNDGAAAARLVVFVPDEVDWRTSWGPLTEALRGDDEQRLAALPLYGRLKGMVEAGQKVGVIVPRGVGPSAWDPAVDTQIRRRFALVGQTLDGMRAWDVLRCLDALRAAPASAAGESPTEAVELIGQGESNGWVLWAAVFDPTVERVTLIDPPATVREAGTYLNLERILEMPQAVSLVAPREVVVDTDSPAAWEWTKRLAERIGWDGLRISRTSEE